MSNILEIFENSRLDIVVVIENEVEAIKLTVCFNTNTAKFRLFKQNRYQQLRNELLSHTKFKVI